MTPPATTSPRTIRIGLLSCGNFSGPIEAIHGSYAEVCAHYWKAMRPPNANIVIDIYNIMKMNFPDENQIHKYDIFMITGSTTSAYDDTIPWVLKLHNFLVRLINNYPEIKVCGICFGHQIVCRALGGACGPNGQWEIGPTTIELTDIGKTIFGVNRLTLQEMHRDHVQPESLAKELASGELQLIGSTGITKNQGIIKFYPSHLDSGKDVARTARDIHVLTLQGHPEFSESMVTDIVRELVDVMGEPTVTGYWGMTGGGYDDVPESREGTGRRWVKTDGLDVVANVLWKMLDAVPVSIPDDHDHERPTFITKLQKIYELPVVVAKVGSTATGWFIANSLNSFTSNLFWKVLGRVLWW